MSDAPYERVEVPFTVPEKESLQAWLDSQRATVLWKVDGLDDEQLRRSVVPSGLTLLGLVKHLWSDEHGWFVHGFARSPEPNLFESDDDPDLDFHVQPDETTAEILEGYRRACERSRNVIAKASLDDTFEHPRRGPISLRWIMIHMIEETARHLGHADIIREQIDGATGY